MCPVCKRRLLELLVDKLVEQQAIKHLKSGSTPREYADALDMSVDDLSERSPDAIVDDLKRRRGKKVAVVIREAEAMGLGSEAAELA
jgi:cytidylate kinase